MAGDRASMGEDKGDLSDLKRKLAWRMAFAGLMIVALLGGLALFDYLGSRPSEPETVAPQFTQPVPVGKKAVSQPVTPAEPAPEPQSETKDAKMAAPPAEASAAPVDKSAPKLDLPPRPEVAAQPALPRPSQPSARTSAVVSPPARTAEAKATGAAVSPPPRAEAQVQSPVQPSRLYNGFVLQAGVFADPRRAEELHAKLTLQGIPSTIEARVHVGPFKDKAEAEAARGKLRAMGIDPVLVMPKGGRR